MFTVYIHVHNYAVAILSSSVIIVFIQYDELDSGEGGDLVDSDEDGDSFETQYVLDSQYTGPVKLAESVELNMFPQVGK